MVYLDGYLKDNLEFLKKCVADNWDGCFIVDGVEGGAKSTVAGVLAKYLDPNFNIDNLVFSLEQFKERIAEAPPGTAIVWDEFVLSGALSTEALTKQQIELVKLFTTIRKKRLYLILVIPWIFLLNKYIAVGRARFLINVFTPDGITRGRFKVYAWGDKKTLYFNGRQKYDYGVVKPTFHGRFTKAYAEEYKKIIDPLEYDKKKEQAILNIGSLKNKYICPDCDSSNLAGKSDQKVFCRKCAYSGTRDDFKNKGWVSRS